MQSPIIVELDTLLSGLCRAFTGAQKQLRDRQDALLASLLPSPGDTDRRCLRVVQSGVAMLEVPLLDLVDRHAHRVAEMLVEFYCEMVEVTTARGARLGLLACGPIDSVAGGPARSVLTISIAESSRCEADRVVDDGIRGCADANVDGEEIHKLAVRLDGRIVRRQPLVLEARSSGSGMPEAETPSPGGRRIYLLTPADVENLRAGGLMIEPALQAERADE